MADAFDPADLNIQKSEIPNYAQSIFDFQGAKKDTTFCSTPCKTEHKVVPSLPPADLLQWLLGWKNSTGL